MSTPVLQLLDAYPDGGPEAARRRWADEVRESLEERPETWVSAVSEAGSGSPALSKPRAWVLLGWAEEAVSEAVAAARPRLLETIALALALEEAGPLDPRDVMIVGILLHRAAVLLDTDFHRHVRRGCERAGDLGPPCRAWLARISERLPNTHEEVGTGSSFAFRRKPPSFDPAALERKLTRRDPA